MARVYYIKRGKTLIFIHCLIDILLIKKLFFDQLSVLQVFIFLTTQKMKFQVFVLLSVFLALAVNAAHPKLLRPNPRYSFEERIVGGLFI